jgi:hypothetical protein
VTYFAPFTKPSGFWVIFSFSEGFGLTCSFFTGSGLFETIVYLIGGGIILGAGAGALATGLLFVCAF